MQTEPTLLTFGLLMIASALTLMAQGPRTWLMAIAQGLGIQAFFGALVSAVQIGWFLEGSERMPINDRVLMAVRGIPFNAAGWTTRSLFERLTTGTHPGAMSDLTNYLPIAAVQLAIVSLLIAWRKMQEESLCDVVVMFITGVILANSVCNIAWPWWGQ